MQTTEQYEPLAPEDLELLVGLAGPMYAQSKMIESMTSDNPVLNGAFDDGSSKIKRGLENIQRNIRQNFQAPRPIQPNPSLQTPIYTPPAPEVIQQVITPVYQQPLPVSNEDQMEFNFNVSEQKKTNDLLEKNNKLLQKIISLLESKNKNAPIKLETKVKGV
jgi:hypothetical protein